MDFSSLVQSLDGLQCLQKYELLTLNFLKIFLFCELFGSLVARNFGDCGEKNMAVKSSGKSCEFLYFTREVCRPDGVLRLVSAGLPSLPYF